MPQYQKAILKVRFSEIRQAVSGYAREFETYYLANGEYPGGTGWASFKDTFATELEQCTPSGDYLRCGKFTIDIREHNNQVNVGFAPGYQYGYAQWYTNSAYPDRKECLACSTNQHAIAMCKSFGGNQVRTVQYDAGCAMKAYEML